MGRPQRGRICRGDSQDARGLCYNQTILIWDFDGPVETKEPPDQ
jgi:hypothetical protein